MVVVVVVVVVVVGSGIGVGTYSPGLLPPGKVGRSWLSTSGGKGSVGAGPTMVVDAPEFLGSTSLNWVELTALSLPE